MEDKEFKICYRIGSEKMDDFISLSEGISKIIDYRGKTPKKLGSDWVDDGVRVISAKNVHNGTLDNIDSIRCVTREVYEKWMKDKIYRNDIFIASEGASMGESMIWESDEQIVLGQRLFAIRTNPEVLNPFYLAMYIRTPGYRKELENHCTGTSVLGLSQPSLLKTQIRFIPIEEQNYIGDFYRDLCNKVRINNDIIANLEKHLFALYDEWFGKYKPYNVGVGGNPEYELEEGWEEKDIYSIANIIYGAPFASKYFNTDGVGIPIVRIRDLKGQDLNTFTDEKHPKGYLLQHGDIVVGMDGEFRPYIWGEDEAWLNQRVCVFDNIRKEGKAFLYCTIKPLLYSVEATEVATTVIHIGKKDFDEFRFIMPPEDVLCDFESITNPMYDRIVKCLVENRKLIKLRDSLLPKLMSGEISIPNQIVGV